MTVLYTSSMKKQIVNNVIYRFVPPKAGYFVKPGHSEAAAQRINTGSLFLEPQALLEPRLFQVLLNLKNARGCS